MRLVLSRLAALLADPVPVLSALRIGIRHPALVGDLPLAGVDLALDPPAAVGLGRIGREGKQVVRTTAIVTAGTDPGFDATRRFWQIPQPLARDPSGRGVEVRAGTLALSPSDTPQGADQFRLDAERRRLIFGAPQEPGRVLEIAWPSLAFSEDIRFARHAGVLGLTLWTQTAAALDALAEAAEARLADRDRARGAGFLRLDLAALGPAALSRIEPVGASPFAAFAQRLAWRFTFEAETGGEALEGGRIRSVTTEFPGAAEPPLTVT